MPCFHLNQWKKEKKSYERIIHININLIVLEVWRVWNSIGYLGSSQNIQIRLSKVSHLNPTFESETQKFHLNHMFLNNCFNVFVNLVISNSF